MSLKAFFNRESPVVRSLEVLGVALAAVYLWKNLIPFDRIDALFLLLLATSLFVFACDLIRWYPDDVRPEGPKQKIGIEVHFLKARVPTSYILVVASLLALWRVPYLTETVLILTNVMMLVVAPVNGILIAFHKRDKDPLPVNYFSSNLYLKGDAPL